MDLLRIKLILNFGGSKPPPYEINQRASEMLLQEKSASGEALLLFAVILRARRGRSFFLF